MRIRGQQTVSLAKVSATRTGPKPNRTVHTATM